MVLMQSTRTLTTRPGTPPYKRRRWKTCPSLSYVTITTDSGQKGFGLAFTLGRGNEIVCHCIDSLRFLVIGVRLGDIFDDMGSWLYKVNNEGQLRWLGPEKGVIGEEGGDMWGITAVTLQVWPWPALSILCGT